MPASRLSRRRSRSKGLTLTMHPRTQVTFGLLLNLVAVANSEDKAVLWAFLQRYAPAM
jgi:lysyl-tRNA synthetase class I